MEEGLRGKIILKQTEIRLEANPVRKQELQKELTKLQLKLEIEKIRKRIEQMG